MADELTQRVISIILRAENQMNADVDAAAGKLQGLSATAQQVGRSMQVIGGSMMLAGAGLAAGIGVAVKAAADYGQATTALVTGAGESQSAIAGVSDAILKMAPAIGSGPTQLAQGLYMIESAGFHGAAGLEVLQDSAMAAKVGLADQATVADATTSALNAYGLGADQAQHVTDQLLQTVSMGKMHMQDLAGSIGTVLPAAAAAGVGLDQVGAALATMTEQGTDTSTAATYLRMALLRMQDVTGPGQKALESIGLTAQQMGNVLTTQGLLPALQLLQEHLDEHLPEGSAAANAALTTLFGGVRSGQVVLELANGHLAQFSQNLQAMDQASANGGRTMQGWATIQGTAAQQFSQLSATVQVAAIQLGNAFIPALEHLAAIVLPMVAGIGNFAKAHADLTAKLAIGTAAALLIGGAFLLLSGTVTIIGAAFTAVLIPVIGAVITAIVGLGAPVLTAVTLIGALYDAWAHNWLGIHDIVASVVNAISSTLVKFLDWLANIGILPQSWKDALLEFPAQVAGAVSGAAAAVSGFVSTTAGSAGGFLGNIFSPTTTGNPFNLNAALAASGFDMSTLSGAAAGAGEATLGATPDTSGIDDMGDAAGAAGEKLSSLASATESVVTSMQSLISKGISSFAALAPGLNPDLLKPGANGPFEAFGRLADVAENLGKRMDQAGAPEHYVMKGHREVLEKGAQEVDTARWAATLTDQAGVSLQQAAAAAGMDIQSYARMVTTKFQEGLVMDPDVLRWINQKQLAQMYQTQSEAELQQHTLASQIIGNNPAALAEGLAAKGFTLDPATTAMLAQAAKDNTLQELKSTTGTELPKIAAAVTAGADQIVNQLAGRNTPATTAAGQASQAGPVSPLPASTMYASVPATVTAPIAPGGLSAMVTPPPASALLPPNMGSALLPPNMGSALPSTYLPLVLPDSTGAQIADAVKACFLPGHGPTAAQAGGWTGPTIGANPWAPLPGLSPAPQPFGQIGATGVAGATTNTFTVTVSPGAVQVSGHGGPDSQDLAQQVGETVAQALQAFVQSARRAVGGAASGAPGNP